MSIKALTAAALVIVLALSPSISECITAHKEEHSHRWAMWGWVILVIILALIAGEELLGAA